MRLLTQRPAQRFLARLGSAFSRPLVRLTHIEVAYVGSFIVHASEVPGHVEVELAWSRKTETVFTADGDTWSRRLVLGPDIDRVLIEDAAVLPTTTVSDVTVTYPIVLGERRGTVRTVASGVVRLPVAA